VGHFKSNLRDITFNLFEVFTTQEYLGKPPFAQMDPDTARGVLTEVERLASTVFADSFVEGDRIGAQMVEEGTVVLPEGINRAMDAFFDGEWHRMQLPERLGGFDAPPSLRWAASEMLLGANPAALMTAGGPFFAGIIDPLVTDEQRERWVRPMVERRWGGTMVLTEPDAGSDVGAGRTTAVPADDGTWHLQGTKRFITNGDFDWPENIIHLVLARPELGPDHEVKPGTKGLSLFIVPKYWVNEDGSLGERNGVVATGLEDKMGLKSSATCTLTFGEHGPARGVLVGEVHNGIRQMFDVIEYARMLVGTKAIATLSTGYLNALAYAKERVQGPDLAQGSEPTAPRVQIIRHPDVRRMLMTQKAHVEGMRALVIYTATVQDQIWIGRARGEDVGDLERLNDLLLPLVKGYGSERSYELLALSLQTLGGSGYCRDYPMEQYLRDAKIDTLYEGTTGIQGMDLFFRKIGKDQGATLARLLGEITELAKGDVGNGALQAERGRLATALADVQGIIAAMVGFLGHETGRGVYMIGLHTTTLLFALSELVVGWLLLRQAEVAFTALSRNPGAADRAFYDGKVAAARFFTNTVLPDLSAKRAVVEATDLSLMDLEDAAF
jgi:alkylation response protein AidB-like acyl-CoA dehydrogenase